MKKVLFLIAVSAFFALSSCKKEKDCACTVASESEFMGEPINNSTTVKETIKEGECSDLNDKKTETNGDMTMTVTTTCVEE